jgi:multiple sugar transport system ATP-binding protein
VTHDQTEAMTMATRIAVMRDGILQQLDTPQVLYDKPVNVFVAGFIGSPSMNFFDAKISRSDSTLFIDAGAFAVPIPADKSQRFSSRVGKEIIFGIRPEHIHDPQFAPPGITAARVETRVDVTEPMGNEVFLYLVAGEHTFIARVDPRTRARMGDRLEVSFDMSQIHVFDRDTQVAVH